MDSDFRAACRTWLTWAFRLAVFPIGTGVGLAQNPVVLRVPDGPLVFTGQITAANGSADATAQAEQALQTLEAVLARAGSDLSQVVRLNGYGATDAAIGAIEAAVAKRFPRTPPPGANVRSSLATPGANVAFDAVASTSRPVSSVEIVGGSVAILPAGAKAFISGQAERGTDLASGARLTMAGLHRSLAHLGLKKSDVVQVKAFIRPFSDHAATVREIAASFEDGPIPPIVLLEWESELFTEIELVASARGLTVPAGESITFSWLPWLTKSPRYCNATLVASGVPLIFIGAVDGGATGEVRAQMKTMFERLGSVLFEAGSSYRNLAKATYYLNDRAARPLLGEIRGVYFDPTRPPAASAIDVKGLGRPGRAVMVDMIAVPVK